MKKNLLFIIPSLSSGGGERSLVNLLSQIDYTCFNVDLFLLNHEGLFMEFLPKEVRVLPVPENYKRFSRPILQAVPRLLVRGRFGLAFHRFMFSLRNRLGGNTSVREQKSWRHMSRFFDALPKQYDTAIGFLEKTSTYFCVEKVKASRKIGWIHIDYDQLGMDPEFDQDYFTRLDYLVTVSEECASIMKRRFPDMGHKVNVIHNIVSPTMIRSMASGDETDLYERGEDEIVIASIGRLHHQKGFELAVEACRMLVDRGYKIQWNVIGEGEERARLTGLIRAYNLDDRFRLLGLKSNPYPYIEQADLYVQTSRFEGKSIAIDEAKILNKPIVVTNFSTAKDQIENGVNGLIVDMDAYSVARGIERLINDKGLRTKMASTLSDFDLGTEDEIHKLYSLIG